MHLVLLGDSILDNGAYTNGGPAVIEHLKRQLPDGWRATLRAIDGSTTEDIEAQLKTLPEDASQLVLSVGGNNALLRLEVIGTPVASTLEAMMLLAGAIRELRRDYRKAVEACLARDLPLVLCTIYNGNFPNPNFQESVEVALAAVNDVIIRTAVENDLKVIDLRLVCTAPADYVNEIEPSDAGGAKVARAIARAVTEPAHTVRGARVVGG